MLAAQSLVLTPIVVYAVVSTRSAKTLDAAQKWLERHPRVIVIANSLVSGLFSMEGHQLPERLMFIGSIQGGV